MGESPDDQRTPLPPGSKTSARREGSPGTWEASYSPRRWNRQHRATSEVSGENEASEQRVVAMMQGNQPEGP